MNCKIAQICALLLTVFHAAVGSAQRPFAEVPKTALPLELDGLAQEEFWQGAASLDGFTVYEPNTGIEQRVNARGKVIIGPKALYFFVHVTAVDGEIFAPYAVRDNSPGDFITLQLDPYGTGRRAFLFRVNARGVLADARIGPPGVQDYTWDSLFDAATQINESSWSAEITIPFQSLRFDPAKTEWLAHVYVNSWYQQQAISWAPIDRDQNNWLIQGGRLNGFGGQTPGRAIEAMPTLATSWVQDEADLPGCDFGASPGNVKVCGAQMEYGLGLKWGVTPSLTFDAVFNPDFSQVEADPGILDLNARFSIRLPERRPFFLEGADIFKTDYEVFYSRTVVQPDAALKLTGRAGDVRIGTLAAIDPLEEGGYAATEVGRFQVDLSPDATVGVMAVQRDAFESSQHAVGNTVIGLDGQAFFMKRVNLEGEFFASRHQEGQNPEVTDVAGKARAVFKTDSFRVQSHYRTVGDDFRSDAGFIPRTGFHEGFLKLDWYYRSDSDWARNISPGVWARYNQSTAGEREDRVFGANTFWRFGKRMWLFGRLEHFGELVRWSLDDDLPKSNATWTESTEFAASFGSSTFRFLDFNGGLVLGQTPIRDNDLWEEAGRETPFVGWRYGPRAQVIFRPSDDFNLVSNYAHYLFYDAPGGQLLGSQPVLRTRARYFLTRNLNARFINQWTPHSNSVINDLLLAYNPMPGTVFFAGYRQTNSSDASVPVERVVFLKYSVLFSY